MNELRTDEEAIALYATIDNPPEITKLEKYAKANYPVGWILWDEFLAECRLQVYRACKIYDPTKGMRLDSYATERIKAVCKASILKAKLHKYNLTNAQARQIRAYKSIDLSDVGMRLVSLDSVEWDISDTSQVNRHFEDEKKEEQLQLLQEALLGLDLDEIQLLNLRFCKELETRKLAKIYKITHQGISRKINAITEKLRKKMRENTARDML